MAYNRRKRKVKKNIPEAQAHISTTYNNTLVTITDKDGNTISWASSGTIGYKGSKKKTSYAAGLAAESAGKGTACSLSFRGTQTGTAGRHHCKR